MKLRRVFLAEWKVFKAGQVLTLHELQTPTCFRMYLVINNRTIAFTVTN
jgi:hypothetical protein